MDAIALHLEIRNAITLADELGRFEHGLGNDDLAGHFAAMRTALGELEREVGRSHEAPSSPSPMLVERLQRSLDLMRDRIEEIPAQARPRMGQLMASLERVVFAELRPTSSVPAKEILGGLPVRRVVPQNAHSVIDYLAAIALLASARIAKTRRARSVGIVLGAQIGGASLLTDYRLSASKLVPIELHELVDHATGASAVFAPFVFGYSKKDPVASAIQVGVGVATLLASLFTDYRAHHGIARPVRSRRARRRVVSEVQRPLEGLSASSILPRATL
jgi:hypothetical protein